MHSYKPLSISSPKQINKVNVCTCKTRACCSLHIQNRHVAEARCNISTELYPFTIYGKVDITHTLRLCRFKSSAIRLAPALRVPLARILVATPLPLLHNRLAMCVTTGADDASANNIRMRCSLCRTKTAINLYTITKPQKPLALTHERQRGIIP